MIDSPPAIAFVHGIWMNGGFMRYLGHYCQKQQFQCHYFSYPTVFDSFEQNVDRFSRWLESLEADKLHIVAHSLGGLLALDYLAATHSNKIARVVLLASPVCGSHVAARLSQCGFGRLILGGSRQALVTDRSQFSSVVEIGVIAGTVGLGLGRLIAPMDGGTDGAVTLDETRLPAARDWIALPVSHSGLLLSRVVAQQVVRFLINGRFSHGAEP